MCIVWNWENAHNFPPFFRPTYIIMTSLCPCAPLGMTPPSITIVATLLWPSVGVKPNTWKSWDLESSGTPECSELDKKAQNTLHWGVLDVIGKVLKRRYRKCPRIGHLDICHPSYGQKKGRESNWQFDSRSLKVGNQPLPKSELRVKYVVGKISTRATSLVQTSLQSDLAVGSYELPKSRDSTRDDFGTISGLHFGSPRNLCHLDEAPTGHRRVYYREYGGGILLSPGRGESCGPKCPWLVPTPKGVPESDLTTWVVWLCADSSLIN